MRPILFLFLLLPFYTFAQILEIKVFDKETNEPLPFSNIYFKKAGLGASTNMEGITSFKRSVLLDLDSIIVSYIGYDDYVSVFLKKEAEQTIEIKLSPSSHLLSEIVVKYVEPPNPRKVIKNAIKNISKNYSSQAVIYKSLYRELIKEDGHFIQLNEAFVNTHYTGYPKKKLDRHIWKDWSYDDSYAFEMEGNRYFVPLLKDFNTKEDHQTIIASRNSENLSRHGIETTLVGDPLLMFALDKIKYQYDFFNPSLLKKYVLKHLDSELIDGEPCYVISFLPKEKERRFVIDQSRKNKSAIYIGRMYISKASFALLKFQYKLAVARDFGFFEKRMPLDYKVEMNYKKQKRFYHIDNIKFSKVQRVGIKSNGEAILQEARKELYVTNVQMEDVKPFPDSIRFKSTRFSSIRQYRKYYSPEYWNSITLAKSLQLSQKVISDLELNQSLDEQFKAFVNEEKVDLPKPTIFKEPFAFQYHNETVVDSLHWMALPDNENKFKKYIQEENNYAKNEIVEDRKYQKKLFGLLNDFYEKDTSSKAIKPGSFFVEQDSFDHVALYHQLDSLKRIEVLNLTAFQELHKRIFINRVIPNHSKNLIIVQFEKVGVIGDFVTVLPFGNMDQIASISNVYTIEWFSDSTFLYSKTNKIGRAGALYFGGIGMVDSLIHLEQDHKFDMEVVEKDSQLLCTIQSKTENEIYSIKRVTGKPKLDLIKSRKDGVMIQTKILDGFYLLINDENTGSRVEYSTFENPSNTQVIANSDGEFITDILPSNNKVVALVFENAIPKIKYLIKGEKKWKSLKLKLGIGVYNLLSFENEGDSFVFSFSSPSKPYAKFEYHFKTDNYIELPTSNLVKPRYYKYINTTRKWATSFDGVKIPITLMKSKASAVEDAGLILKTYGAYGAITIPSFYAQDAILLAQGYTIAYAHVRGESILGKKWYRSGRELHKRNSILDYIACAEHLIAQKITTPNQLIGYGNSAGGLIVAQAINLKPELFNTVILSRPYLDVVNTMMNDTLPLTIDEYKEWGNPQKKEVYDYMLSYSPYQNIKPNKFPNVLLIGSYQDFQTPIWQIAKYTAKLRENNLADTEIIMLTDMTSGHVGNTTGKEWIKLFAEMYSFVHLKVF